MKLPSFQEIYRWALPIVIKAGIGIILLLVGLWLIRLTKKWLRRELLKKRFDPSLEPFILNTIIIILQALLIFGIMQVVGIQMSVYAALIGALGVAAGLALSGTLQNFTSGILIILLKPYRVGDNIIAQGQDGIVDSIEIFYTIITTFDHKTVIIPNSKLSNEVIINLSRQGKRRLDIEMKFNYGFDLQRVKSIITTAWVHSVDYERVKFETKEKIVEELKVNGVKFPGM